jgi:hypothetical protein
MNRRAKYAFLALILVQAAHSIEEYTHRLWEVLAPARFLSGLFSSDLASGFIIVNLAIVAFGLWCYLLRIRPDHPSARGFVVFWILIEGVNGVGHAAMALAAGGYTPGLATAPLLLALAVYLSIILPPDQGRAPAGQ